MRLVNGIVIGIALVLALALADCGGAGAPAASTESGSTPATATGGNAATAAGAFSNFTSAALLAGYENALPASTQLALGILRLEDTPQAVTPAQAKTLLPLWQAFQGSALQNQAERNAVLKQIEGTLTPEQVKAIAAMQLTRDDESTWMEEHGMPVGPPGNGGPAGPPSDMTDEQRAAFRATVEASGGQFLQRGQGPGARGTPGAGGPGNMTDEQRQAFRATAEASGGSFPLGPGPSGTPGPGGLGGQRRFSAPYRVFVGPLVEMLTQRAAG
jgi:hypothetical protein